MQGIDVGLLTETIQTWYGTKIAPAHLGNPCKTILKMYRNG